VPAVDVQRRILQIPWKPGPDSAASSSAFVSVTELTLDRLSDLPGAYWNGMSLRRDWPRMPGAIGLWAWTRPWQRRLGSVSVWRSEADLRRFIRLPVHIAIMKTYRPRGVVRGATWTVPRFDPAAVWEQAVFQIDAWDQGFATLR
jgi:hypothetical protein